MCRLEDLEDEQMAHASEIAALQSEVQSLRDLVCQLMNPPPPGDQELQRQVAAHSGVNSTAGGGE